MRSIKSFYQTHANAGTIIIGHVNLQPLSHRSRNDIVESKFRWNLPAEFQFCHEERRKHNCARRVCVSYEPPLSSGRGAEVARRSFSFPKHKAPLGTGLSLVQRTTKRGVAPPILSDSLSYKAAGSSTSFRMPSSKAMWLVVPRPLRASYACYKTQEFVPSRVPSLYISAAF